MANHVYCAFCGTDSVGKNVFRSQIDENLYICEDCIMQTHEILQEYLEDQNKQEESFTDAKIMTPQDIRQFLDQYVIGQDYAKEVLSVAVYNHMKMLEHWDNIQDGDIEVEKSNIIMCGPSGSGRQIA